MSLPGGQGPSELRPGVDPERTELASTLSAIAHGRRVRERVYGRPGTWLGLGLFFFTVLAGGVAVLLHESGLIAKSTLEWLIPTAMLSVYFFGLVGGIGWLHRRSPAGTPAALDLSPPPLPAVDFDRAARQVRLASFAEPRLEIERATRSSLLGSIDLILGASLLLPLGLGLTVFSLQALAGTLDPETAEPSGLALGWLTFSLGAGLLIGLRLRKRSRRAAQRVALEALAASLAHGQRHDEPAAWFAWLNETWAAPSAPDDLFVGSLQMTVTGQSDGYPLLIDLEPDGYSDEDSQREPRLLVYLAAHMPSQLPGTPEVASSCARLAASDFVLEVHAAAGLVARATPERLKSFRRNPQQLVELHSVASGLRDIAKACGAAPALPDRAARQRVEAALL